MLLTSPLCCKPAAHRLLGRQLSTVTTSEALLLGALAISMHQMNGVKVDDVRTELEALANRVRSRVRGSQPQALLAHLHDVLFEEDGFKGDQQDY